MSVVKLRAANKFTATAKVLRTITKTVFSLDKILRDLNLDLSLNANRAKVKND